MRNIRETPDALDKQYTQHTRNLIRLKNRLPDLQGIEAYRAQQSIDNIRRQMLELDKQLMRNQCREELA